MISLAAVAVGLILLFCAWKPGGEVHVGDVHYGQVVEALSGNNRGADRRPGGGDGAAASQAETQVSVDIASIVSVVVLAVGVGLVCAHAPQVWLRLCGSGSVAAQHPGELHGPGGIRSW